MLVIALSVGAIALSLVVQLVFGIGIVKVLALFFGLEGTVLLASAFSPPHDAIKFVRPKGILSALLWEFNEGRDLNYPINYNRLFFYGGLSALALSMVLSTISSN